MTEGWVEITDEEAEKLIELNDGKPLTEGLNRAANLYFISIVKDRGQSLDSLEEQPKGVIDGVEEV